MKRLIAAGRASVVHRYLVREPLGLADSGCEVDARGNSLLGGRAMYPSRM